MSQLRSPAAGPAADHRRAMGATVRRLRAARGLTQHRLAALLDVSPATLSAVESGGTGISSARAARIAGLLDVTVQQLYAGIAETTARPPRRESVTPSVDGWRVFAPLRLDAALEGALSSFLEFGYHGATMRTIATRAGLSVPGLYHHYAAKQDLLVALLDLTMTDLSSRIRAACDEADGPVGRFTAVVECLALYHTHRRQLAFVGASEMRSLAPTARDRVAALRREVQRIVDVEVDAAVAAGDFRTGRPREAARAVVTMCTALAQWFREDGPASAERVAAQYVEFALALVESESLYGGVRRAAGPARAAR